MELVLSIATFLGGIAAVWFFWDKVIGFFKRLWPGEEIDLAVNPTRENIEAAIVRSDAGRDWKRHVDGVRSITSYQRDVNLRFEVTYDDEGTQNADFREPWANRHPDPNATGYWCRLYYGSSLIETFILVSVDGGRAMLPLPTSGEDREHPGAVKSLNHKVAQIHDTLGSLDEYMRRSGLIVGEA